MPVKFEYVRQEEFTDRSTGQLIKITDGVAFVPDFLPPHIEADWQLTERLDQAARALARLDGQASIIQNKVPILRPLLTREAVESARLEGTHTHIAGVLLQQAGGQPKDPAEATNNLEVLNYVSASESGEGWIESGRPISLGFIEALHTRLLRGTR